MYNEQLVLELKFTHLRRMALNLILRTFQRERLLLSVVIEADNLVYY